MRFKDALGLSQKGKSKLPKTIKDIVCNIIKKGNEIADWGVEAQKQEEMQTWQRNIERISHDLKVQIETCIRLYCDDLEKLRECIDEASEAAGEARRREDERHIRVMEQLMKMSTGRGVSEAVQELCRVIPL